MAEHLDKDAKTYADEYVSFRRDLKSFHDSRGTSFAKLPRLHGHEVDLYLLYSLVTSRGGWEKVNLNGDWESLLPYFGIHRLCANGPIALKQIYIRYLDVYERVHFLGEEVDRRESELHEEDDARNRRKALRLLHATPISYNATQHVIQDSARGTAGFSTDTIQVTPTERIFLSLLCPLPNEQDFAINVCSLLAIENRKPFPLRQCPRIIDALLAHAGVFSQVNIRDLFVESYRTLRGQNLARFWKDVVADADIVQLLDEDFFRRQEETTATATPLAWSSRTTTNGSKSQSKMASGSDPESNQTDREIQSGSDHDPESKMDVELESRGEPSVIDPESSDGHLFARPLRNEKPVGIVAENAAETVGSHVIEDESQCSVAVFENGVPESGSESDIIAADPSPIVTEALDFKNCLQTKSEIPAAANGLLPPTPAGGQDEASSVQSESSQCIDTVAQAPESTNSTGGAGPAVATPSLERKIHYTKNKLPTAVVKPDNPRAIRYWLQQRRQARPKNVDAVDVVEQEDADLNFESLDLELFHLGRELGVHDVLGQRVLQVLNIIRNLSFDEVNSCVLAESEACVRLLLLAAHAKWSCLPQIAFDALSNLASEVKLKEPADCLLSSVLLGTITRGLESSDRFIILRCMESLSRMAQRNENVSLMVSFLDSQVYEKLCSYLTIPDVALLIYTLECVYALSSLGQATCNAFLHCPGTLDVLISLLTIEAQSYGSKARILMNVVETVAEGETVASHPQFTPLHSTMRPIHSNSPAPSAPSTPPPLLLQPVNASVTPLSSKIQPKVGGNSRPSTPTQGKSNLVTTVSQPEKEQIAMQWLKATFEPLVGAPSIEQNVLYKQYTAGCSKNGPKYLLATMQFYSCVRATFGQNVGPFRKQVGCAVEFYFEGMSPKTVTSMTAPSSPLSAPSAVEMPASPILKAQLCAPPKPSTTRKDAPKTVPTASSCNQVVLSSTATALPCGMPSVPLPACTNLHVSSVLTKTTSTCIVSSNTLQNVTYQVTQRQQQQRLMQQQQEVNGPSVKVNPPIVKPIPPNTKVNGTCQEVDGVEAVKLEKKGMLADLLEREVKKESINGATVVGGPKPELRIGDNGLELIPKDARGDLSFDLVADAAAAAAAPKAAHLIAQVDDSGHVQIHLEESGDNPASMCNGQSLLDQLEACEVSSSTDPVDNRKSAVKRPADDALDEGDIPAVNKKCVKLDNDSGDVEPAGILEKAMEMTLTPDKMVVNGNSNGVVDPPILPAAGIMQPVILGPNAPRTFLILQPQNNQSQARLSFPPQGQRLLLAIQRPGGGVQHVAMPTNVVSIASNQLQTNGGVVTLTSAGGVATVIPTAVATSNGDTVQCAGGVTVTSLSLPANSNSLMTSPITTVATTSSSVVTTSSIEGVVTFSGGAVAFPARATEVSAARASNPPTVAENHVTITPVSAAVMASSSAASSSPVPVLTVGSTPTPVVVAASTKKRNNSSEGGLNKPRSRPIKSKSTDGTSASSTSSPSPSSSSPNPQPDGSFQYMCEWKECMKTFKTPHEVYVHACQTHCPAHIDELGCLWERCDGLKRRRFSMMTHLMDRHCNDEMQKLLAVRRFQMNTQGKTDIPAPQVATPHPGYAPHAALHAIKRHAVELMNQKEQEEKEGPVTKSIRLTSALILRNVATHSSLGRRCLQRYESHLASVALSNVESSRTVAQILYELTHQCS